MMFSLALRSCAASKDQTLFSLSSKHPSLSRLPTGLYTQNNNHKFRTSRHYSQQGAGMGLMYTTRINIGIGSSGQDNVNGWPTVPPHEI